MHRSLQQPVLDETLIASGQHQVAQLMEDITQRMGKSPWLGCCDIPVSHLGD